MKNTKVKKYKKGGEVFPTYKADANTTNVVPSPLSKIQSIKPTYENSAIRYDEPKSNPMNDYILKSLKDRQTERYDKVKRPIKAGDYDRGSKYKAADGVELTTDQKLQGITDLVGTGANIAALQASANVNKDGTVDNKDAFFKGAGTGASMGRSTGAAIGTAVGGPLGTVIGGAIGTGVGAIAGGLTGRSKNIKRNKQIAKENAEIQAEIDKQQLEIDKQRSNQLFEQYNSTNPTTNIFKYGGQIYAKGGQINQITPSTGIITGNTHAEGGVDLTNGDLNSFGLNNGNYKAVEAENNEVIYDAPNGSKRILSDKLGYSDIAKKYMSSPVFKKLSNSYDMMLNTLNKSEDKLKTKLNDNTLDKLKKNTYRKQLNNIENRKGLLKHPLDDLFLHQEINKPNQQKGYAVFGRNIPPTKQQSMLSVNNEDPFYNYDNVSINPNIVNYDKSNLTAQYLKNKNFKLNTTPLSMTNSNNKTIGYYGENYLKPFGGKDTNVNNEPIVNNVDTTVETTNKQYDWNKGLKTLNKGIQTMSPYLDNILNERIINNMQAPAAPKLNQAEQLKTNVDINAQLQNIQGNASKISKFMDENSANSAFARNAKGRIYANSLDSINAAYANKNQLETSLINQDKLNKQGVNNANAGLLSTYGQSIKDFRNQQALMKSQNISNAVTDYRSQVAEKNLENLDKQKLIIDAIKNGDTNVAVNLAMYSDVYDEGTIKTVMGLAKKDKTRQNEYQMLKKKYPNINV